MSDAIGEEFNKEWTVVANGDWLDGDGAEFEE
jgi:hypothetical protein